MSAPSVRRLSVAAAAVATAAVCGTLLAPAASATPNDSPLTVALGDVSHNDVARGQNVQTFTLTVDNPSDTAQDYTGLAFGTPSGPSPILGSQILFEAAPVTAPATDVTLAAQDQSALVEFSPKGGKPTDAFSVPAHGSLSWKITFGFREDYPLNDDGITLAFDTGSGSRTVHFDVPPAQADGKLTGTLGPKATVAPGRPGQTWYEVADTAGGAFQSPLRTLVYVAGAPKGMDLQVLDGSGRWVSAKSLGNGQWTLPQIPTGFKGGDTKRYAIRFTVPEAQGSGTARDLQLTVMTGLAQGNTSPIADQDAVLHYDPALAVTATPSPSASASATPSATDSAPAPAATTDTPATNAPSADGTGQLARTGSSSAGLFAGLAVLFAAAGALVIVGARRRHTAR